MRMHFCLTVPSGNSRLLRGADYIKGLLCRVRRRMHIPDASTVCSQCADLFVRREESRFLFNLSHLTGAVLYFVTSVFVTF